MVPSIMASRPGPKAVSDHHTTTTTFDCWHEVLFMKCSVGFTPDVTGLTPSLNVQLLSHQFTEYLPKVLGIIKISFGKSEASLCVLFGPQAFALELSHGFRFCPVSFLLLNHEH